MNGKYPFVFPLNVDFWFQYMYIHGFQDPKALWSGLVVDNLRIIHQVLSGNALLMDFPHVLL